MQWNINTRRQVQVWYHGEHQLENVYSQFRCVSPLLYYQYLRVGESGKSPWYLRGWRLWILQNFEFPHPFSSNSKQYRKFFPQHGQRSQFIPLYSPTYSPGWPVVLPQGQADDMCIRSSVYFVPVWFLLAFVFNLNTRLVLYQHCKEQCVFCTSLISVSICFSCEYQTGSIPAL